MIFLSFFFLNDNKFVITLTTVIDTAGYYTGFCSYTLEIILITGLFTWLGIRMGFFLPFVFFATFQSVTLNKVNTFVEIYF